MSEGAIDRKRFETIEAYLLGTLPHAERLRFESEMAVDDTLRREVEMQRDHTLAVQLGGFTRMLEETRAEQAGIEQRSAKGPWSYLKYAAAVALVASAAVWWLSRPTLNERLYAEYMVTDPGLPVAMGATDDYAFHDAMVAYKLGDHQEAIDKWTPLLQEDPANDTLRFYIASATLASGDAPAAIPLFEGLGRERASAFRTKAMWYLLLAYVKQGERDRALSIALDDDAVYGERVRAIKAELQR